MSILLGSDTRVLVQGATGAEARRLLPTMTDYGTRVVAGVSPGKGGESVGGVPVYGAVAEALKEHEVDLSVLFVPARFVREAALEAIEAGVPTVHILAEGVPHHDACALLTRAAETGTFVIGPNSQGMVSPGRAKLGGTGGEVPDLMFRPGPVGVVSRSGGMGAEICLFLTREGIGQSTYVALGGDLLIGSAFVEMLALFERDPETRVVVMFGEPGTDREEEAARFIASGGFTKPGGGDDPRRVLGNLAHAREREPHRRAHRAGPRRALWQEKAPARGGRPRGRALLPGRAPRETSPRTSLEKRPTSTTWSGRDVLP